MKYTLNMTKVKFDLPEKHLNKEEYVELWNSEAVQNYFKSQETKPLFLLHDGPPYANGDLHLGHFTNKVLKDTLLKFKRLNGFYAPLYNGSDCHGLPVELAVEKKSKLNKKENPKGFLEECYTYSNEQASNQREQVKGFGVFADYTKSYQTTDHKREAGEMQAVLDLLDKGFLFQKFRPVYWCKDCQSSLAEAELEYKLKQSDSLTVEFKLDDETSLLVWTTTPYTLPANQAVAYNKRHSYAKYFDNVKNKYYVKLKDFEVPDSWSFVSDFSFDNVKVVSPYHKKLVSLYHADFVEQSGTGFVHVAPSFGLDDFHLGEAHNLETKSYVNEYGKYNTDEFPELMGLDLKKATSFVLEKLNEEGLVYHHTMFNHEYPHCWRHKTPLFSKTSKEWFMDLSNVKDEAQQAADKVEFYPENGKTRLKSMLEGRSSWCVSRNRLWGVPLPKDNTVEAMEEYKSWMNEVEVNGLSAPYEDPTFKPQTLDVWFDSGMTHTTVVKEEFGFTQSDLYLEGSDQHRGWFQSSLLTSLALNGSAPYKQVLTHGFVVDEKGVKLSKSVGNYVSMEDLLKEYSPDTLRLWALGQDYSKELTYSKATLNNALERYKKFRNTLRFMLQNLDDFDVSSFELNMDQLDDLDKYVVEKTNDVKNKVLKLADEYRFNESLNALYNYCDFVSTVYLDSQKDRLYCLAKKDPRRVSTQQVLFYVQHNLMLLLLPFMPYSTEEFYAKSKNYGKESVLMEDFLSEVKTELDVSRFDELLDMRVTLNKMFEQERVNKTVSKNNEMFVYYPNELTNEEVSVMELMLGKPHFVKGESLLLKKHDYHKCDRCWNYFQSLEENGLCSSCHDVEKSL